MGALTWGAIADIGSEAIDGVESMFGGDDGVPLTPGQGGGGMTAANPKQAGLSSAGGSSWWEKAVEKMMPSIMGAAMKPQVQQRAPVSPSGHGVQASTSGIMKPFDEIRSMADDNPLENIHQWSNLFG